MKLTHCVLTLDGGVPVLRPLITREQFRANGTTKDAIGIFSYQDALRLTPARRRALLALIRTPRKDT